jgi:predicted dehydrogenase
MRGRKKGKTIMAGQAIAVLLHGITGRMGQVAHQALNAINAAGGVKIDGQAFTTVPIGLGRDKAKLTDYARKTGLEFFYDEIEAARDHAVQVNHDHQVYHNLTPTGARVEVLGAVLPLLDPSTTGVFCEKPVASNYAEGREAVEMLERGRFVHGVVHDMLETAGVRRALQLLPQIAPIHCTMVFGYEVGPGLSGNEQFRGQRPDFNWSLSQAGGGIILDMCHEAYVSRALFGETDRLSAVARLIVPQRRKAGGDGVIDCEVEDYASIRREHASGVVNNSVWTWMRRVNSEFGPLEITVEGLDGTVVFGLHGLKIQWKESAPALHWADALKGRKIEWRDHWESAELEPRNPFAVELARFIRCLVLREPYPYNATVALDWLGEVEAIYQSAARHGEPISHDRFLHYPDRVPEGWQPERLQRLFRHPGTGTGGAS